MRKPVPFLKDEDLEKGLDDLDGAGFLAGGLCCPDDLLDDVMDCFVAPAVDYGFLEALGIGGGGGGSPPRLADGRPGDADGGGLEGLLDVVSAPMLSEASGGVADFPPSRGVLDDFQVDFDVDMFFADGTPHDGSVDANVSFCPAPVATARPPVAPGALDGVVHDRAPTSPARGLDMSGPLNGVGPDRAPARGPADLFGALDGVVVPYCAPPLTPRSPAELRSALLEEGIVVPYCAPPLPAGGLADARGAPDGRFARDNTTPPASVPLDAVPAWPSATSSTSSGCLSSMTWETESPARVSPPRASWVVPRKKKRHQPITRRNHFWLPKSQLYSAAPANAPPRDTNPPSLKSVVDSGSGNGGVRSLQRPEKAAAPRQRNRQRQRACSHCSNTETPQWRAGPRGPGTLCNACGIRFKNKKLFEEYRPSTSPSFESDKHSNRHRKVVKLRERKALLSLVAGGGDTVQAPVPPNPGGEFMDVCTYISTD